jgi:hypothetical protein
MVVADAACPSANSLSIRQHPSASVSIRQHTVADASCLSGGGNLLESRVIKAEEAEEEQEEEEEEEGERDRPPAQSEVESEGWDILVADCIDPGGMLRQGALFFS